MNTDEVVIGMDSSDTIHSKIENDPSEGTVNPQRCSSEDRETITEIIFSHFKVTDTDGSLTVSSREEVCNLAANVCNQLHRQEPGVLGRLVTDANSLLERHNGHVSREAFADWFVQTSGIAELQRMKSMTLESLNIRVCTWNVGNSQPAKSEMALFPAGGGGYDLIVVGVQECAYSETNEEDRPVSQMVPARDSTPVHTSLSPCVASTTSSPHNLRPIDPLRISWKKVNPFVNLLLEHANYTPEENLGKPDVENQKYVVLDYAKLGSMRCVVLVRREHMAHISEVCATTEATGLAHVGWNKGGLLVRFNLGGTSFAFLSCHLAAHEGEEYLSRRHSDLVEVLEGTSRGCKGLCDEVVDVVSQTDLVWLLGDLNYRLRPPAGMSSEDWRAKVLRLIECEAWEELWQADELQNAMKSRMDGVPPEVLHGFQEAGPYQFAPTFKFKMPNNGRDYNPKRTPSYCDRILWHTRPWEVHRVTAAPVECVTAHSTSDHLPVCADFQVTVPLREPLPDIQPQAAPEIQLLQLDAWGIVGMDPENNKSDCVLRIWCSTLSSDPPQQSHHQFATLTPSWSEEQLPFIRCLTADRHTIRRGYIQIAMLDASPGLLPTQISYELMGTADVPLMQFVDHADPNTIWEVPLVRFGKPSGFLRVKLAVVWPEDPRHGRSLFREEKGSSCWLCWKTTHGFSCPCTVLYRHLGYFFCGLVVLLTVIAIVVVLVVMEESGDLG